MINFSCVGFCKLWNKYKRSWKFIFTQGLRSFKKYLLLNFLIERKAFENCRHLVAQLLIRQSRDEKSILYFKGVQLLLKDRFYLFRNNFYTPRVNDVVNPPQPSEFIFIHPIH